MKAIYGLYVDPDDVQRAVEELRRIGVAERDISISSSEPIEEYEFSRRDRATWLHWIAGAGGATGLVAGYLLASGTQRNWPLETGGMPIVSLWPDLIVMFEMTMLGAILATVITLFVAAQIPSRKPTLYDPEVADGKILVGVENPPAALAEAMQRTFVATGAARLAVIE